MKINPVSSTLNPHRVGLAMNRRAAFLLGIGSAIGLAWQAKPTRAETRTAKSPLQNLKVLGPERQVVAIRHHCGLFEVKTADGRNTAIATVNLHFKIDSSDDGPSAGRPVMLPGGMMGDRATVFFASPLEIGTIVKHQS